MYYASLIGSSIDYSCATMEGPFDDTDACGDYCDERNSQLRERGIPSSEAHWVIED